MFFILSTRMFPPIAVAVPIFIMYRKIGLGDTHLGIGRIRSTSAGWLHNLLASPELGRMAHLQLNILAPLSKV